MASTFQTYNMLPQTQWEEIVLPGHQIFTGNSLESFDASQNNCRSCQGSYPSSDYKCFTNTFDDDFEHLQYQNPLLMVEQPEIMAWTNTASPMLYFPALAMSELETSNVVSSYRRAFESLIKEQSTHNSSQSSSMTLYGAKSTFTSTSQKQDLWHGGSVTHSPINGITPEILLLGPADNLDCFNGVSFDQPKQTQRSLDDLTSKYSVDGEETTADIASTLDDAAANEPYAKLIYRALSEAPTHSMALQEIYNWFAYNTYKARLGKNGWKSSIRYNLSVNAAFKKLTPENPTEETKKNSIWILDGKAVKDGRVYPTSKYRKNKERSSKPSASAGGRKSAVTFGTRQGEHIRYKQSHGTRHNPSSYFTPTSFQTSTQHNQYSLVLPWLSENRQITPTIPMFDGYPSKHFNMKQ